VGLAASGSGQLRDVELRTDKLQLRLIDDALREVRRRSVELSRREVVDLVLDLRIALRQIAERAWLDADAGPAPRLYESEAEGAVVHKRPLFALRGSRARI
jgi:hypothetical protein